MEWRKRERGERKSISLLESQAGKQTLSISKITVNSALAFGLDN
jgi:hypothetical protein